MNLEQLKQIIEDFGLGVYIDDADNSTIALETWTPLGEDWYEEFDFSSVEGFIDALKSRIDNWDTDEEVEPYIEMRGKNGIPESIRDLIEDADWKLEQLKDLLNEIEKISNEEDRIEESREVKTESENAQTDLEKAFTTEVKYWLGELVNEKSNDEIGLQAQSVLDNEDKIKEIVDELVNGSDDLWEDIHIKIEKLAGIEYRNRATESKKVKTEKRNNIDHNKLNNIKTSDLPDLCYGVLPTDGSIIIIKKGERGYYPTNKGYENEYADITDWNERNDKADELCNKLNAEIGVTPEERMVMELRSMSGNWTDKKESKKFQFESKKLQEEITDEVVDCATHIAKEIEKIGCMNFQDIQNRIVEILGISFDEMIDKQIDNDVYQCLNYQGIANNFGDGDFYTQEYAEKHPEVLEESKSVSSGHLKEGRKTDLGIKCKKCKSTNLNFEGTDFDEKSGYSYINYICKDCNHKGKIYFTEDIKGNCPECNGDNISFNDFDIDMAGKTIIYTDAICDNCGEVFDLETDLKVTKII